MTRPIKKSKVAHRGSPRRAPSPDERLRDAERTKQLIVDAAASEFAAKGFAGARVDSIARSAGVNKQLIAYYFDGKEGLYRSVVQQRVESKPASPARTNRPFAEIIASIWDSTMKDPIPTRLLLWQALETADHAHLNPMQDTRIREMVIEIQQRQRSGELADDYDPETIVLVLMASLTAPISLPQVLQVMAGGGVKRSKFIERYCEQVQRLFASSRGPREI